MEMESSDANPALMDTAPGGEAPQYPPYKTDIGKPADQDGGQLGGNSNDDHSKPKDQDTTASENKMDDIQEGLQQTGKKFNAKGDELDARKEQGYGAGNDIGG